MASQLQVFIGSLGELHVDDPHQRRSPHALQAEARYN